MLTLDIEAIFINKPQYKAIVSKQPNFFARNVKILQKNLHFLSESAPMTLEAGCWGIGELGNCHPFDIPHFDNSPHRHLPISTIPHIDNSPYRQLPFPRTEGRCRTGERQIEVEVEIEIEAEADIRQFISGKACPS